MSAISIVLIAIVALLAGMEGILDEFQFHQPLVACTLIGLVTGHLNRRTDKPRIEQCLGDGGKQAENHAHPQHGRMASDITVFHRLSEFDTQRYSKSGFDALRSPRFTARRTKPASAYS